MSHMGHDKEQSIAGVQESGLTRNLMLLWGSQAYIYLLRLESGASSHTKSPAGHREGLGLAHKNVQLQSGARVAVYRFSCATAPSFLGQPYRSRLEQVGFVAGVLEKSCSWRGRSGGRRSAAERGVCAWPPG